jgi:simple sugar transport system ATP-binding protein
VQPPSPPTIEVRGFSKRFGSLLALDGVSVRFDPGGFYALLGENGAGKSTLVKCMMGFYRADEGELLVNGLRHDISNPRQAHALGLGMVYQQFTVVPSMSVAENLVLGRPDLRRRIDWRTERNRIADFLGGMPFRLDPEAPVHSLAAGEKQKLEILRQLYLGRTFLILDEPTSVLTPGESQQVLSHIRTLTERGALTVVLITHKLREVLGFAREVAVLRAGRRVGGGPVEALAEPDLTELMFGRRVMPAPEGRAACAPGSPYLQIRGLRALNDRGVLAVNDVSFAVRSGEIVGIAGVSGNGQRELVEVLAGQRRPEAGQVLVRGRAYGCTRDEMRRHGIFLLAEEPLQSGCVRSMTVGENLALRMFDAPRNARWGWFLDRGAMRQEAEALMAKGRIKARGVDAPIEDLSGGNVQRVVLARELSGRVALLIAHNPCRGLDYAATTEIRSRLVEVRGHGAAVLLLSEDLDELLELADRVLVFFEGRIVYECARAAMAVAEIGRHMAGQRL